MKKVIWMEVSRDDLQLPTAVADTRSELARIVGCKENTIDTSIYHYKTGRLKKERFIRVEYDENDEE